MHYFTNNTHYGLCTTYVVYMYEVGIIYTFSMSLNLTGVAESGGCDTGNGSCVHCGQLVREKVYTYGTSSFPHYSLFQRLPQSGHPGQPSGFSLLGNALALLCLVFLLFHDLW